MSCLSSIHNKHINLLSFPPTSTAMLYMNNFESIPSASLCFSNLFFSFLFFLCSALITQQVTHPVVCVTSFGHIFRPFPLFFPLSFIIFVFSNFRFDRFLSHSEHSPFYCSSGMNFLTFLKFSSPIL